ncbi:RND family efflux transporter MFP subunit [Pseudomonas fluorescens]|uniref:RND family efflux transporter MFP subunit n=1 Tax=Pseudomonas fluorescens TaxID=294 RepID=A0A379IF82_PSEFL|nr:efflux RND transporter periplasmic adaptor subunit [Pseudomonas fluorescens]SUD31468.1 RND family efflux transporter MFP subunit [Pseudomonas fluorescens]
MNRSWPLRALHILPFTAVLLAGCDKSQPLAVEKPAVDVGVYTVKAEALTLTTDLPGRTSAFRVAEVRPQVSGILQKRLFEEGSEVRQGQQLYQIDPATYQAELAKARASLGTAEKLAQRYERLLKTNAVSRQQYDDAYATWKQAQAEVQVSEINVRYTRVLAPVSGRIGRSAVTEGALVTNGQATELATVTQLDPIYVDVTQPITRILGLQRALASGGLQSAGENQAQVNLSLDDGSTYSLPGVLKFSEVSVDQGTGSVTLRAVFPNPEHKLLPGMFVHAELKEGVKEGAKLVPQQAIIRDSRGVATAWVLKADNTVELRDLQTLRTVGNSWLVGKGIEAGDKVVTEGLQRLKPGTQVKPTEASNVDLVTDFSAAAL